MALLESSRNKDGVISMMAWNIEGAHKVIYKETAEYLRCFDIVALIETWIGKDKEVPVLEGKRLVGRVNACKEKGSNRGRHSGGILVFVNNELKNVKIVDIQPSLSHVIWMKCDQSVFGFVYNAPSGSKYACEQFYDTLETQIMTASGLVGKQGVLACCGDFNSRCSDIPDEIAEESKGWNPFEWNSGEVGNRKSRDKGSNKNGEGLINLCKSTEMRIVNGRTHSDEEGQFTFMNANGSSVVDYCLVSLNHWDKIADMEIGNRMESCHFPVIMKIKADVKETEKVTETTTKLRGLGKYIYNQEKREIVLSRFERNRQWLEGRSEEAGSVDELDRIFLQWNKRCFTPFKMGPKKSYNMQKKSTSLKRKADKKLEELRRDGGEEVVKEYIELRSGYINEKRKEKKKNKEESIAKIELARKNGDWRSMWKIIGKNLHVKNNVMPSMDISANEWLSHFDKVLNVVVSKTREEWLSWNETIDTDPILDIGITNQEICKALKSMKNNKAPGKDGIPTDLYKQFELEMIAPMKRLFNKALEEKEMPKSWGEAVVVPLYKGKGNKGDANNYRGISLLSCRGKVMARILTERLERWEKEKNVITELQAGFRPGRSTCDQMVILDSIVKRGKKKRLPTYVAWIDLEKCFDSIDREALWYTLAEIGISKTFIKLVKSLYDANTFSIRIEDKCTEQIEARTGILQGSQLSPMLFAYFINSLAKEMQNMTGCEVPYVGLTKCPILMFADDCALVSRSVVGLQKLIRKLEQFCEKWNLKVNVKKTKITVFKNGAKLKNEEKWVYKSEKLEVMNTFNYLGVRFSFNSKWRQHLIASSQKATFVCGKIISFCRRFEQRDFGRAFQLFDALVTPMVLYGCEVFAYSQHMEIIEKVERKFMRNLIGLSNGVPGVALEIIMGRVGLKVKARLRAIKYWRKIQGKNDDTMMKKWLKACESLSDQSLYCLGSDVRNDLERMGLAYLWKEPMRLKIKTFMKIVKKRMWDIKMQQNLAEIKEFKSANYLASLSPGKHFSKKLQNFGSHERKRLFFKIMFNSFEGDIQREEGMKICRRCSGLVIDDVVSHLILDCDAFENLRKNLKELWWYKELERLPVGKIENRSMYLIALKQHWDKSVVSYLSNRA